MVRSMNLRMTVQAGSSEQKAVVEVVVHFLTTVSTAGVTCRRMALLAQQWRSLDQQGRVVAAMWLVAQCAVLGGRRVFPQKWPALFRMTEITGLIDGRALQQEIVVAIVRVMAAATRHVAETQRMATWF